MILIILWCSFIATSFVLGSITYRWMRDVKLRCIFNPTGKPFARALFEHDDFISFLFGVLIIMMHVVALSIPIFTIPSVFGGILMARSSRSTTAKLGRIREV